MTSILCLTRAAISAIEEIRAKQRRGGALVRVCANPHGRVSDKYTLEFISDEDVREDDEIVIVEALRIVVDRKSAKMLEGTELDYVTEMWSAGFRFNNPDRIRMIGDPIARDVSTFIEQKINPTLSQHGGGLALVDLHDGVAYVEMQGGCQGCGMALRTLEEGVRSSLISTFGGYIVSVVDLTDHASGERPYYS